MPTSLRAPILLSTLVACASACAQSPIVEGGGDDAKRGALVSAQTAAPSGPSGPQPSVAAADQELLRARLPGVRVHTQGGRVVRMVGEAMATGKTPGESAESFRKAATLALGIPDADVQPSGFDGGAGPSSQPAVPLDLEPSGRSGAKSHLFAYEQVRNGVPVLGGRLLVSVTSTQGNPVTWAASSLRNLGDFSVPPGSTARPVDSSASVASLKTLPAGEGIPAARSGMRLRFTEPQLIIYAGLDQDDAFPRLAVRYEGEAVEQPGRWLFIADAQTGEILKVGSLVLSATASGSVRGIATVGLASAECSSAASTAMAFAQVSSLSGATAFTGPLGNFTLANAGTSPLTLTSPIQGLRFDVIDQQGADEVLSMTNVPPALATFVHNQANTNPLVRAQVNVYIAAMQVRDFALHYIPNYPTISTQQHMPLGPNIDCDPNDWNGASYSLGGSIATCRADATGVYNNMGFSTVVYHEYGHHLVHTGGGFIFSAGALDEGIGDSVAAVLSGDPLLARGLKAGDCGSSFRSADNTCQFSATACSSCGSEIHACGKLVSGIVWDIRKRLLVTHPSDYQDIMATLLLNSILKLNGNANIDASLAGDFLAADRDQYGTVGNQTAHQTEICNGFAAHGIACPVLPPTDPCALHCANPLAFTWSSSYQSGSLGTGAVCRSTTQAVVGGNCGNLAPGRSLYVNGTQMVCNGGNWASVPPRENGGYCVSTTAGDYPWAFFTLW